MKNRAIALADHLSGPAIAFLAAVNMMFLALFLLVAASVPGPAQAAENSCNGKDLLPQIAADEPAKFAEMQRVAAQTPNGAGLLWRVEKPGATADDTPSFLFGTMHLTDKRVIDLPPSAEAAFSAAGTVVIETTDILDQQKSAMALVKQPELMMFTDDRSLDSLLKDEDKAVVEAALEDRGITLYAVRKMKPWMLAAMVSLPACEQARKAAGASFLDLNLAERAKADGKQLAGLETVADQLGAMASLPMDLHVQSLVETIRLGDQLDDIFETMIVLYEHGETGMVWPLFRASATEEKSGAAYAEFEEVMVTKRNHHMADAAAPIIDNGSAFIAVGALHLPGQEGLVELLRAKGYTVSRVN
jgi:uncharacterized protein YbaP (TraB family)